jgi:hemerythrin-like metal-binding protein
MRLPVNYHTGVNTIDQQHDVLFGMLECLKECKKNEGYHTSQMTKLLNSLQDYIEFHFTLEESFMTSYKMPDDYIEKHLSEHNNFRESLRVLAKRREPKNVINAALTMLEEWLLLHIGHTDKLLGEYIKDAELCNALDVVQT